MIPSLIFSRTKSKSISRCLVRSWNTGFLLIWIMDLLSQYRGIGFFNVTPKSFSNVINHMTSAAVVATALYSASVELLATVVCFFDLQLTKDPPRKILKPVVDFLVDAQPPSHCPSRLATVVLPR
ncbi:hypothetical protein MLD38_034389 [Melastoma candidum]|uniref:Uncharacterized protein n=1 Tax=Melastoma candidum TaxID=119954 RepID=A0ACB9MAF1_9MYRT|nr:hypothetical protein MLD38_034389 [Melastoma candidum]